jgi:CheY-like chemotaxis protein
VALKVLLADDSVPAQNMGKKILTDAGYEVTTVSNGLEAIRKIAETVPDIAILDIFMPGYTGLEICERLRANVATAEIPVILTVGKLEPYRAEDGEQVRSNAVIIKPFAADELISAVRDLIGAQTAEVAPVAPARNPRPWEDEAADADSASPFGGNGAGHIGADAEPPESKSLAFDPEAAHTPFRVAATEAQSAAQVSAEVNASGYTEFHLQPEASADFAETGPKAPAHSWHPAAETARHSESGLAVATEIETSELETMETEEVVSSALAPGELESSWLKDSAGEPATGGQICAAADDAPPAQVPEMLQAEVAVEVEPKAHETTPAISSCADQVPVATVPAQSQEVGQVGNAIEVIYVDSWPEDEGEPLPPVGEAAQVEAAPMETSEFAKVDAVPEQDMPEVEPEQLAAPSQTVAAETAHSGPETGMNETSSAADPVHSVSEAERIQQTVDRVFDRFKPLLVEAIVRELARRD